MAEKEERIAVAKMIVNTDDEGSAKLGHFKIYSSQEAIEKMAKGIVNILAVQPGTDPDPWEMWKDYAEAALNALLSKED